MVYTLDCDACEFGESREDRADAYALAKDHELEHPTHNVFIHRE